MRTFIASLTLMLIGLSAAAFAAPAADDMAVVQSRLFTEYLKGDVPAGTDRFLATLDAAGKWPDVSYADRSRVVWQAMRHLDRLSQMAFVYQTPGSAAYHSPAMRDGIERGLNYWFAARLTSDNRWWNGIGQQLTLMRILILMQNDLPPSLIGQGAGYLNDLEHADPGYRTGENLVWNASQQLVRGVLRQSASDVREASDAIEGEVTYAPFPDDAGRATIANDGLQVDFSFHQHGPLLYNGGYGLDFIEDESFYAALLSGTQWCFPRARTELLADYLLEGERMMVRGTWFDYSAIGREIARRNTQLAQRLVPVCDRMAALVPDRAAEITALKEHIEGSGDPASFVGNRHFYRSDFMVQQRPAYYISVKMTSVRTRGTETVNNENLKGYWLPYGLTYIVQRGDEYAGIQPVWDWARLPGVTAPYAVAPVDWHTEQTTFVGGVSDGRYGAAAMALDKMQTQALKAWFFFDREMVALGTGIRSTNAQPVATTINQTLLRGPVLVDGRELSPGDYQVHPFEDAGAHWVLHDGVAYVFPIPTAVEIKSGTQTGSWQSISASLPADPVSQDVFTLWLDHGVQPSGATYAYVVVPASNAAQAARYAQAPGVRILANDDNIQAVRHDALGVSELVFHRAGRLVVRPGLTIAVDQPCLVLLTEHGRDMSIAVANPAAEKLLVTVTLLTDHEWQVPFDLPGGEQGGSSVIQHTSSNPG
jgi:hypothetical protein